MELCCIPGCIYSRRTDPDVQLFEFPKNPDYAAKWIRTVNMNIFDGGTWFPKDGSKVCRRHFVNSDFRSDLKTFTLKPKTVPSVFTTELPLYSRMAPSAQKRKLPEAKSPMIVKVLKPAGVADSEDDDDDTPLTELLRDSISTPSNTQTVPSANGTEAITISNITSLSQPMSSTSVLKTPVLPAVATNSSNVSTPTILHNYSVPLKPQKSNSVTSQKGKSTSSTPLAPHLIEIGPNTFLKVNPDVIKVTKKVSQTGNTVMQFSMNPTLGVDAGAIFQQIITDANLINTEKTSNVTTTSINVMPNESVSGSNVINMTNGANVVPVVFSSTIPATQPIPFLKTSKQACTMRQKNRQIHAFKAKMESLAKKVEELETKCAVQERKLDLPSLKKLRLIKKSAEQGDGHANFILEQIRGFAGISQMRWSPTTMNQCSVWCRKAPYAYEYFKKADLFRLPCLGTVKRYIRKHPEITQQIKNRTINAHVVDSGDSSSDFDFDEYENDPSRNHFTSNPNQVSCINNEDNQAVSTIIPDTLPETASSQMEEVTDAQQPHQLPDTTTDEANCENGNTVEQLHPLEEPDASTAQTSQEVVETTNVEADSNSVYLPADGQITTLNVNGQEIILQPGNIIQLNSGVDGDGGENQYFVIPSADDASGADHPFGIAQPVSFVIQSGSGDDEEQVIFITEETATAMEAAIAVSEANA